MKLIKVLKAENISAGWLYFYIHFVTEVICFFCLTVHVGDSVFVWAFPFVYDALAFVPQSIVGELSDRFPKVRFGSAGILLMAAAGLMFRLLPCVSPFIPLIILCIGNVFVHVNGAEVTLRCSCGKLSHSAIFVAGGSFGVITGRVFAQADMPYWLVIIMVLSALPFSVLAQSYRKKADSENDNPCEKFNYANPKIKPAVIILLAVFVVTVRGYMGYGIPTTWKKTVFQSVVLYFSMGIGKALGGIFSDAFGVKKTAVFSACAALPLILAGDNRMMISLLGVLFFSMTMSITLALLVSVLKHSPGLAFGWTTIGLFLGTVPIFFIRFRTAAAGGIMITVFTALSVVALCIALRKDGELYERR